MQQNDDPTEARKRYEQKTASLVGQRITGVTYWDVCSLADESQSWDHGDWHEAVMGVELQSTDGPWCVLWTGTFYAFGVEVFHEPITNHFVQDPEGPKWLSVEDHPFWRTRVGSFVRGAATYWEEYELGPETPIGDNRRVPEPETEIRSVPIALRLDFESGPVWMVAAIGDEPEPGKAFVGGDQIMVVFSAERMRSIGFPATDFVSTDPGDGRTAR